MKKEYGLQTAMQLLNNLSEVLNLVPFYIYTYDELNWISDCKNVKYR
jgi:hypothetical protein